MKAIFIFTLLILFISCSENDDCEEIQLTVNHFDCENTKYSLDIDIVNDYTIIRSQVTYDTKVSGDCHPSMDFSQYDLLIGKQSSSYVTSNLHSLTLCYMPAYTLNCLRV